jgi:thiamine-phosphate pyrophosphorylase
VTWLDELRLVAITDLQQINPSLLVERWQRLAASAREGSVAIDLRAPGQPARQLVEIGTELGRIARTHGQRFLVNDRLDVLHLLEADGIHLREDSVAVADARDYFQRFAAATPLSRDGVIFRACHSVVSAAHSDADASFLSPILEARKGNPALGVEALREARAALEHAGKATRLFALGGVDASRAAQCLAAGAHGVAAMGAALGGESQLALLDALGIRR